MQSQPAVLLLEDGTVFHGKSAGKIGTTTGDICFNTGMTGYQEIFTDPSYFGQIIVMTNAHIGNYGTRDLEVESNDIKINGDFEATGVVKLPIVTSAPSNPVNGQILLHDNDGDGDADHLVVWLNGTWIRMSQQAYSF